MRYEHSPEMWHRRGHCRHKTLEIRAASSVAGGTTGVKSRWDVWGETCGSPWCVDPPREGVGFEEPFLMCVHA